MAIIKDTYLYKSEDVARLIAARLNEGKIMINITKIQKLLYIAYGTWLRVFKSRLLNECPQAWPYGPVFPTSRTKLTQASVVLSDIAIDEVPRELLDDDLLDATIHFVLEHFGDWPAGKLTEWSHSAGSPWDIVTKRQGFVWGQQIPDELIYNYFATFITVK